LKNYLFILILSVLFFGCSKSKKDELSEESNSDSISIYLKASYKKGITEKVELDAIDKAYEIIKKSKNTNKNRDSLFSISMRYYNKRSWEKFSNASKTLLNYSIISKDSINLGKAYRYRAGFYKNTSILDSSFYYYLKSEKIYFILKDKVNYANILFNKGIVQHSVNDYLGAELSLSKAYYILKNTDDKIKYYGVLNELGLVYIDLFEYDLALKYLNEALQVVIDNNLDNEDHQKSVCLSNIGFVYQNKENYKKAIYFYNQSLSDKNIKIDNPELYSNIVDNLCFCKLKINDDVNLYKLLIEALQIRQSLNNKPSVILSYNHISEYYLKKGDLILANTYSKKALDLAIEIKNPVYYLSALKQASRVNNKYLPKYTKDYTRINDSLQIEERKSKDRFARISLETDEIIQEKDVLEDRNRNLLYVFIFTVILASLLFIVRAQRTRTRELLYKQTQQKANEEIFNLMMSQQAIIDESRSKEKKRLARDLHDGVLGRMFGLRMNLDSLNNKNDEETVNRRLELLNELKTIEQDIREVSHDLNREKQELINNFVSLVHNLLEEQQASYQVKLSYSIDNNVNWDKINNSIKINMYRMLQEGLQNINKYANAKNSTVEIKADEENICLKIKDDGIGFDVNKKSKGIGVQNMISRTHECQGTIDIKSEKDNGTQIIITIPIITKQIIEAQA
jgi:signal transduction histidine kinase